jgi:hypothetical protein
MSRAHLLQRESFTKCPRNQRYYDCNWTGGGSNIFGQHSREFLNFKDKVYFSSQARANLLSFSRVWEQFYVEVDRTKKIFKVFLSEFSYMIFREINHLFIYSNCQTLKNPALLFIVTTSLCQDWVIYAPAAFLGCGSRFSGSLSGIEP